MPPDLLGRPLGCLAEADRMTLAVDPDELHDASAVLLLAEARHGICSRMRKTVPSWDRLFSAINSSTSRRSRGDHRFAFCGRRVFGAVLGAFWLMAYST